LDHRTGILATCRTTGQPGDEPEQDLFAPYTDEERRPGNMVKRTRRMTSAAALAVQLLAPVAPWAAEPANARALERRRVELKIAELEDRLEISSVTGEGGMRETQLALAGSQLELARKLLARSNLRAAEAIAGQAKRALERAEKKEARQ
jgi:hypothetical protein